MVSKMILLAFVAVVCCLHYTQGAPHKDLAAMSSKDLVDSFNEFLHDEKEMAAIAHYAEETVNGPSSMNQHRAKRQSEDTDMLGDAALTPSDKGKDSGFFDRAAKFVMEVMQRFLRWINTD